MSLKRSSELEHIKLVFILDTDGKIVFWLSSIQWKRSGSCVIELRFLCLSVLCVWLLDSCWHCTLWRDCLCIIIGTCLKLQVSFGDSNCSLENAGPTLKICELWDWLTDWILAFDSPRPRQYPASVWVTADAFLSFGLFSVFLF